MSELVSILLFAMKDTVCTRGVKREIDSVKEFETR